MERRIAIPPGVPVWERGKTTNPPTPMRMKGFRPLKKKPRFWTDADICAGREAIRSGWYPLEIHRLAFRAIFEVERISGLRSSSQLDGDIRVGDIDRRKGILTIRRLKNEDGVDSPVILDRLALEALMDLALHLKQEYRSIWQGDKTLLYVNPKTGQPWTYTFHLRNEKKMAGLAGIKTHISTRTPRKNAATTYARKLGVEQTAKILGIRPETVANYDMNDQETMADEIRDAEPGVSVNATAKDIAFDAIIGARAGRVDPLDAEEAVRQAEQEDAAPGKKKRNRFDPSEYA